MYHYFFVQVKHGFVQNMSTIPIGTVWKSRYLKLNPFFDFETKPFKVTNVQQLFIHDGEDASNPRWRVALVTESTFGTWHGSIDDFHEEFVEMLPSPNLSFLDVSTLSFTSHQFM